MSTTKANLLILCGKVTSLCYRNHKQHINIFCRQNVGFCNVKPATTYSNHWKLKATFKLRKDLSRIPNAVQSETMHCSIGQFSGMACIVPPYHRIGRKCASFPIEAGQTFPPKIMTSRYINLYSTSAKRFGLRSTSCHSSQCETRQRLSRLAAHSTARRLEERERELKIRLTSCGKLAALPTGNDTGLKDFF